MNRPSTSTSSERPGNLCCVCRDQGRPVFFARREGCDLWKCRNCGLVYVSPLPLLEDDFIQAARADVKCEEREKVEFWSFPQYYAKYEAVFRHFFDERLTRIMAAGTLPALQHEKWLDLGCGYGFWMQFLREKGLRPYGIEPSAEASGYCRETFGLSVSTCRLEEFETESRFSTIVACDVLEHFLRPDLALQKCHALLAPGGLLYLQVPNVLGPRIPWGHGLGLPYHLWQFNPSSLRRLLQANGFLPLRHWTGVQGVIGVYEAGGPDWLTLAKWRLARALRVGNRLQILARRIDA